MTKGYCKGNPNPKPNADAGCQTLLGTTTSISIPAGLGVGIRDFVEFLTIVLQINSWTLGACWTCSEVHYLRKLHLNMLLHLETYASPCVLFAPSIPVPTTCRQCVESFIYQDPGQVILRLFSLLDSPQISN
jgi:hypothetical protein